MTLYDRVTYDTTNPLTKSDKVKLEKDFPTGEYLVCDDEIADQQAKGEILANLWAFNADFLSGITNLPREVFSAIQEKMSEDCNEAVKTLVKATCGLNELVKEAIAADGRGHFLSAYDNEEIEYTTQKGRKLFLYRIN